MTEKPDYATLLPLIAAETDPVAKQALIDQCYIFLADDPETPENEGITPEEEQLFDYVEKDYIENNPGIQGNSFKSYIGVYIDDEGNRTDEQDL